MEVSLLDLARLRSTESTVDRFLTPRERKEYERLGHPTRRREWLGARACLKAMLVRRGCIRDPIQCEIVKEPNGRPRLRFLPGWPATAVHDCSLSHKQRFACACASNAAGIRVGIDIEQVSPRLVKLESAFVNRGDSPIQTRPPQVQLAVLWSLKEAYSKATGAGLGIALADVVCRETAEGRHQVGVGNGPQSRARHCLHEGYVIALCLASESARASETQIEKPES